MMKTLDIIKRILHFIASVFMYSVLLILVLIIITVVVYVIEEKQNLQEDYYVSPLFSAYIIISPSMEPNINVNDAVVDHKALSASINVGDIITFISNDPISYGKTITHRVVGKTQDAQGNYRYRTKGDNNNVEDSWIVPETHVLGKVMFKIPKLGYVQQFLSTSTGWIIAIVIPSLGVIIYDILKIIIALFTSKDKDEETDNGQPQNKMLAPEGVPLTDVPLPVEAVETEIPNMTVEIPEITPVIESVPVEPTIPSKPLLTPLEPIVIPDDAILSIPSIEEMLNEAHSKVTLDELLNVKTIIPLMPKEDIQVTDTFDKVTLEEILNVKTIIPEIPKKHFPIDFKTIEIIRPMVIKKALYELLDKYPTIELIRPQEVKEEKEKPSRKFPMDFETIEVIKPQRKEKNSTKGGKKKKRYPQDYKNIVVVKPKKKERNGKQ